MKSSGSGEIFGKVQSAGAFLLVDKITVPIRLVQVLTVVQRNDPGHARIGRPNEPVIMRLRLKLKCWIFVMHRVIVATREKRPQR